MEGVLAVTPCKRLNYYGRLRWTNASWVGELKIFLEQSAYLFYPKLRSLQVSKNTCSSETRLWEIGYYDQVTFYGPC